MGLQRKKFCIYICNTTNKMQQFFSHDFIHQCIVDKDNNTMMQLNNNNNQKQGRKKKLEWGNTFANVWHNTHLFDTT